MHLPIFHNWMCFRMLGSNFLVRNDCQLLAGNFDLISTYINIINFPELAIFGSEISLCLSSCFENACLCSSFVRHSPELLFLYTQCSRFMFWNPTWVGSRYSPVLSINVVPIKSERDSFLGAASPSIMLFTMKMTNWDYDLMIKLIILVDLAV
jgi:hypothetical protein